MQPTQNQNQMLRVTISQESKTKMRNIYPGVFVFTSLLNVKLWVWVRAMSFCGKFKGNDLSLE